MPITTPALIFGILLASLAAALFHLLVGSNARQLLLLWLASIVGFAIGQITASTFGSPLPSLGVLHAFEGLITGIILMFIVKAVRL